MPGRGRLEGRLKGRVAAAEEVAVDSATLTALTEMTAGDALSTVPVGVQALVGALMIGSAIWTAQRPGRTRAIGLLASTLVWTRANQGLEGAILLTLTRGHGLTVADLLPPALLALVLVRAAGPGRRTGPVSRVEGRCTGP